MSWVALTWVFMDLPRVAGASEDWKLVTSEGFRRAGAASVLFRVEVVTLRAKTACIGKELCVQV